MHKNSMRAFAMAVMLVAVPALAHHSYTMFDMQKDVRLEGTIKEVQWTNPHIWIQLLVKDATGKEIEWSIEGTSPNMLARAGWTRKSLKTGDPAVVVIHPVKTGGNPNSGSLATLTVNGQRLFGRSDARTEETR